MRKLIASLACLSVATLLATAVIAADAPKSEVAKVGGKAPDFTLTDFNGNSVSLKSFNGQLVVLEWTNPGCPFVQGVYQAKIMQKLSEKYKDKVKWLAINTTSTATNASNKQWATDQQINFPILNDSAGNVGHAYGATNTPQMFVIGTDGTILYDGAITNDPNNESAHPINYVDQALTEILAGKPVSTPETKPWGCTVKYAN